MRPATGAFAPISGALLLALLACGLAAAPAAAQDGGWRTARATYYGAPERIAKAYDPTRGEGSFGILAYGSCGYTNGDGSLPYSRTAYAAMADANPDYPGSCGRCYQIRCKNGRVLNNQGQPIKIVNGLYEGDRFRQYLPAINPKVSDDFGRAFPGNSAEASGEQEVQCWDASKTITVRIADSCPCKQVLPDGAPGVAKGGETRTQSWCCGGQQHFDLAYDAFQQLASPVYGVIGLEYRPVDCDSGAALQFSPGYISRTTIYAGGPKPGWGWLSYKGKDFTLTNQNAKTPSGNAATCITLTPDGGMNFFCRDCQRGGYRPLEGAKALSFWIRPGNGGAANAMPLKMFIRGEKSDYCGAEPNFSGLSPVESNNGWSKFYVPLTGDGFKCFGNLGDMTHIEWHSTAGPGTETPFCLGDIELVR